MKKKLFANWGLKLLSLFLAFGLWYIVVYATDPPTEMDFYNIKVEFLNEEILQEQNKVSEVLDHTDQVRIVTLKGPLQTLDEMRRLGVTVTATADFNRMREDYTIPIVFSVPSQYAGAVNEIMLTEGSPVVKLLVEDLTSKNVRVQAKTVGEPREGFEVSSVTTEINTITVSGATSKVERVHHAAVIQDVTGMDSDISASGSVLLFDEEDHQLDSSAIQRSQYTTNIQVHISATKEVPIVYEVYGTPAPGYQATGVVETSPDTIKVAGSPAVINDLERIVIGGQGSILDITGATKDKAVDFSLRTYLSAANVQLAQGADGSARVVIYIEDEVEYTYKVSAGNIHFINIPEGVEIETPEEYEVYDLILSGLRGNLQRNIVGSELQGTVDVAAWMEDNEIEELENGTFYIPAEFELPENIRIVTPLEAKVTFVVEEPEEEIIDGGTEGTGTGGAGGASGTGTGGATGSGTGGTGTGGTTGTGSGTTGTGTGTGTTGTGTGSSTGAGNTNNGAGGR